MNNVKNTIDKVIEFIDNKIKDYDAGNIYYLWCETGEIEIDQSIDRCWDCAKKEAKEIEKETDEEIFIATVISPDWSDTCVVCEDCGKQLEYFLSPDGVCSELDHFLDKNTKINIDKGGCYSLKAIFDCYNSGDYLINDKKRIIELATKILQLKEFSR